MVWCTRRYLASEQLQEIEWEIRDACMANKCVFSASPRSILPRIEIVRKTSKSHDKAADAFARGTPRMTG